MKPITEAEQQKAQEILNNVLGGDSIKSQEVNMTTTNNNTTNNAAVNEMMNKMEGAGVIETIKVTAKDVVDKATERISDAVESVKVTAGAEFEDFKDQTDDAVTEIKDAMGPVLGYIDGVLGYTNLKNAICRIIYEHTEGGKAKDKSSFARMAQKCRQEIEDYIEFLECVDDEETIKNVISLKRIIGQDADGNDIHQSIFDAFASGLVWVGKKIRRFIKRHFGTTKETNIFGGIGAAISRVFGAIGGIASALASLAFTGIKFVAGYALAVVVTGISIVADLLKFIWNKIKGFAERIRNKFTKEDEDYINEDEDDIDFEDDESFIGKIANNLG